MSKYPEEKENIRNKILDAASRIFAEKGYQNTTVRDICQKADVYQLSINYHFGNKENLFKQVLLKTYQDTHEIDLIEKTKDLSPEKQLEEIIRIRVKSVFSNEKEGLYFKIVAKEISNNYNFIVEIMNDPFLEYFKFIKGIIDRLSGHKLDNFGLNYCVYILMSHISVLAFHEKGRLVLFNTCNPDERQLEEFIQYIKKFICAGIEKIKTERSVNEVQNEKENNNCNSNSGCTGIYG